MKIINRLEEQDGYSILELLIVMVLLSIVSITATSLLFSSMSGSGKASVIAVVKQSGDQAIQFIERQIRNSKTAACPAATQLELTDANDIATIYETVNDSGVDRLAIDGTDFITSTEIQASNFSCNIFSTGVSGEPDIVQISFTLTIAPSGRPSETFTETFRTRTSLRTY